MPLVSRFYVDDNFIKFNNLYYCFAVLAKIVEIFQFHVCSFVCIQVDNPYFTLNYPFYLFNFTLIPDNGPLLIVIISK